MISTGMLLAGCWRGGVGRYLSPVRCLISAWMLASCLRENEKPVQVGEVLDLVGMLVCWFAETVGCFRLVRCLISVGKLVVPGWRGD